MIHQLGILLGPETFILIQALRMSSFCYFLNNIRSTSTPKLETKKFHLQYQEKHTSEGGIEVTFEWPQWAPKFDISTHSRLEPSVFQIKVPNGTQWNESQLDPSITKQIVFAPRSVTEIPLKDGKWKVTNKTKTNRRSIVLCLSKDEGGDDWKDEM
jgi:hypothetical protein